jgi:hypothetical protein
MASPMILITEFLNSNACPVYEILLSLTNHSIRWHSRSDEARFDSIGESASVICSVAGVDSNAIDLDNIEMEAFRRNEILEEQRWYEKRDWKWMELSSGVTSCTHIIQYHIN